MLHILDSAKISWHMDFSELTGKHKNDAMSSYFKHKRLDLAVLESISRKPAPSPQNFRPYLYCNQDKGIFISRMLIPMFMGPT